MLVIWDACQGPAYAYGDEVEDEDSTKPNESPTPQTA
jgi:hypothetical protein